MMHWILLIVILTGCGDTFESELFLKGGNDGQAGTIGNDAGLDSQVTSYGGFAGSDSDSYVVDVGGSSGNGDSETERVDSGVSNEAGSGNLPDATPDTSEPLSCPSSACTDYCALQDDLPSCSDGKCGCQ